MNLFNTPILFIVFNRPNETFEVFSQIKKIKPRDLFIAADGPRTDKQTDQQLCEQTRLVLSEIDWDCNVRTLFREKNLGCKNAVSGAIDWFFDQVEYGIILEDDCYPDLSFFSFCEDLLIKYYNDNDVMLIGGLNFLGNKINFEHSYYFSQYPLIWGWASWKRAWKHYDVNLLELDTFTRDRMNSIYSTKKQRKYLNDALYLTKKGKINTWDYQWVFSILNNKGYAITPSKVLVINLGFRNNSTHHFLVDTHKENLNISEMTFPLKHPEKKINYKADLLAFENTMGRSLKRIFRILIDNNPLDIIKYYYKRIN